MGQAMGHRTDVLLRRPMSHAEAGREYRGMCRGSTCLWDVPLAGLWAVLYVNDVDRTLDGYEAVKWYEP